MKTLVTYYSFSGHTDRVVNIFADILKKKGDVDIQRLRPADETKSFFSQCAAAIRGKRVKVQDGVRLDATPYDLVLIGSPVWAFKPTPAINTFLDGINGLHGKKVVVLLTSGSGAGVGKCFDNIKSVLQSKGTSNIAEVNIPDKKLDDREFIVSSLEKCL